MGVAATLLELSECTIPDVVFVYLHFNIPSYKTDRFGCGNV